MQHSLLNLKKKFLSLFILALSLGATASFAQTVNVVITQNGGQADPTNVTPVVFQATFSEAVTGFGDVAADVTISGTAGATTAVVAGGTSVYTVTVSGMTGPGTVIISIPANAATATVAPAGRQNVVSTNTDNSVTFDATAPTITASSIINNTLGDRFTLRVNANKNSTVFYVVTASATVPSAAQVLAGQNHTGAAALFSGSASATAAVDLDQLITGLTTGTTYHVYSVARDALNNASTVDAKSAIATDSTNPTINSSSIINIAANSFSLRTNIDENATVFYVVTTSATPPSQAQVLAGQNDGGTAAFKSGSAPATAGVDLDQAISGLTVNTTYHIYSVARDASLNASGVDAESALTLCSPIDVTALKISDANTTANLYWTDPTCFDEIMIVAKQGTASVPATITVAPTGNGSAYTPVPNFSGGGTAFDGGKVVFKSVTNPGAGGFQTTNLTTGLIYTFKVFTRKGTTWSAGTAITAVPGPPVLIASALIPLDGATGISTEQVFTAVFNEKIYTSHTTASGSEDDIDFDPATGSTQSMTRGSGAIVISGSSATLTPAGGLNELSTVYDILIGNKVFTDSTGNVSPAAGGVNDFAGTVAGNWNFTTAAGVTITAPTVGTCVNQFTALGDIVLTEAGSNNFQATDNGTYTFILGFDKTGYIFSPGTTGVTATAASGDIQTITITSITFTQATLSIAFDGTARNEMDIITISGLKVSRDGSMAPPAHIQVLAATDLTILGLAEASTTIATLNGGTVPAAPTIAPGLSPSYCVNANFAATNITASDPDAPAETFNWYNDAALTNVNIINANSRTVAQLIGASPTPGTYTRYATQVDGCESLAAAITITVTALPVASAGSNLIGVNAVCPGTSVTLGGSPTATGGTGSYSYAWTGPGAPTAVSNPNHVLPDPGATNQTYNYQVTVTDGNGCASLPATKQVEAKNISQNVIITQPGTFTYTTNNNPVDLAGSPINGVFTGVGVVELPSKYQFDPELAGIGSWPVTYTATLTNGCSKSVSQNFDVTTPYDVFPNLDEEYCNTENPVPLTLSPAMETEIQNYINTWNSTYVTNYGYSPLKTTWTGIIRNEYETYYGDNNSVNGGYFYPSALQTEQAYPAGGGTNGACATCTYAYVAVFLEFASPSFTSPYSIAPGQDRGYIYNTGTVAAIEYRGEFVTVNPVPVVSFSGLLPGYCNINTLNTLTGNKPGGSFEISSTGAAASYTDNLTDGIKDVTEGIAPGLGEFNPQISFGGAASSVTRWIKYSVDPGTMGTTAFGSCTGSQVRQTTIYPSDPVVFRSAVPAASTEFCYEGASFSITLGTTAVGATITSGVTFSGFGVADNGSGVGTFTPKTAFDQQALGSTSPQTIVVTATYTNSQGCAYPITRSFVVRPKPTSVVVNTITNSPIGNTNFCYDAANVPLQGNSSSSVRYEIEYISLNYTRTIPGSTFTFDPSAAYDSAVLKGASRVSDASFNVNYIVTDAIGCTASSTRLFSVSPLVPVTIGGITNGEKFCSNAQPFEITFGPAGGQFFENGSQRGLSSSSSYSSTFLPIGNNYTIRYEYKSGVSQCLTTATYTISKVSAPLAHFDAQPVCDGDAATLSADPDVDNYTWKWVLGDSVRSGTGNQTIQHEFPGLSQGATQTSYLIRLIVQNGPGALKVCRDSTEDIQVVGAYPRADFNYADVCQADFTRFTISSNIPIATAQWNFDDGFLLPNKTLTEPIAGADLHSGATSGTYGQPAHKFSFVSGSANRYDVQLISRTADDVGACADTVRRQVAILEKLTAPYIMSGIDDGSGLWIEEDRSDSTTWEFNAPVGKTGISNTAGKVWITNATGPYKAKDNSFVNSPCFNLSAMGKPVISIQYWNDSDVGKDGAVLQYSTDGGATWIATAPNPDKSGIVGTPTSGVNWYSNTTISSAPGGFNQFGWTGQGQIDWITGKNSLDAIPVADRDNVRFRIAFASDERDQRDGFAFNNVVIEERNRTMLVEHFSNSSGSGNITTSKNNYNALANSEIVKIQYHTSFPAADPINEENSADNNARVAFYGVTPQTMPLGLIDGDRDITESFGFISDWWTDFKQKRSLSASHYTLTAEKIPGSSQELTIRVQGDRIAPVSGNLVLYIAVVQKNVSGNINVLRKFLPNAAGIPVDNTALSFTETVTWMPQGLTQTDLADLAVVAFIQDQTTKEVYQAAGDFTALNLPTVLVTGIEDPNFEKYIDVYPNPASHEVNIKLPVAVSKPTPVELYDAFGRVVYQSVFKAGEISKTISTVDFANGLYMMQLDAPQGNKVIRKLMVKH